MSSEAQLLIINQHDSSSVTLFSKKLTTKATDNKGVTNTGNGERGTGNGDRGTGTGERGPGTGDRGNRGDRGDRDRESGNECTVVIRIRIQK